MKQRPPRCPKCGSLMLWEYGHYYCLACGTTIEPEKVTMIYRGGKYVVSTHVKQSG